MALPEANDPGGWRSFVAKGDWRAETDHDLCCRAVELHRLGNASAASGKPPTSDFIKAENAVNREISRRMSARIRKLWKGDRAIVDDILQDAMKQLLIETSSTSRALRGLPNDGDGEGHGNFRETMRRRTLDAIKKHKMIGSREVQVLVIPDVPAPNTTDLPSLDELVGHIRSAEDRAVVDGLRGGEKQKEIGKRLGIDERTVRRRKERAIEEMRGAVDEGEQS